MLSLLLLFLFSPVFYVLSRLQRPSKKRGEKTRVAVVGGGIAGCGAAWALSQDKQFEVELFESHQELGGNAKTFAGWNVGTDAKGKPNEIRTGVSVVAWPGNSYHNYDRLMELFKIKLVPVEIGFHVTDHNDKVIFDHFDPSAMSPRHKKDLERWVRVVAFCRAINDFFATPTTPPSLYRMSYINPLNVIPLRWVCACFGISSTFWNHILVSVQATSFLTTYINNVPAVIAPLLDDIVPLDRKVQMVSWENNSAPVFENLCKKVKVHTASPVQTVTYVENGILLKTESDAKSGANARPFDRIVFACDAITAIRMITNPSIAQNNIISNVTYTDQFDKGFTQGQVHQNADILPAEYRKNILQRNCNWIKVTEDGRHEVTFILSSWIPPARNFDRKFPLLLTYGRPEPVPGTISYVENVRNHPSLCFQNMLVMLLLRLVQGTYGTYFIGSYATPANCHDMSFLSGLIAARELGAPFPFPDSPLCVRDYNKLASLMGFSKL